MGYAIVSVVGIWMGTLHRIRHLLASLTEDFFPLSGAI